MDRLGALQGIRLARTGKRLRPVFIVGAARSGSSLLYRLIQQQPAFGPARPQLSETAFVRLILNEPDLESQRCWKLRTYLLDDRQAWARFTTAAAAPLALRQAVLARRPGAYARADHLLGAAAVARIYMAVALETRGARRLVEKTPEAVGEVARLLDWFPDCRIIYIHRHPVDVLTSYWRRAKVDKPEWEGLSVASFARNYAKGSAAARDWARRLPDSVRLVSYEQLVADPARTIADLCAFCGESFDPTALGAPEQKGVRIDPLLWDNPVAGSKVWSEYMTAEQAHDLQNALSESLHAFGYEAYAIPTSAD